EEIQDLITTGNPNSNLDPTNTVVTADPNDPTKFIVTPKPADPNNESVIVKIPDDVYWDEGKNPGSGDELGADVVPPNTPNVVINDHDDGFINPDDVDGKGNVTATIRPVDPVVEGDVITITYPDGVTKKTVTVTAENKADINQNGITIEFPKPPEGQKFTVEATVADKTGNTSGVGHDTSAVDTKAPVVEITYTPSANPDDTNQPPTFTVDFSEVPYNPNTGNPYTPEEIKDLITNNPNHNMDPDKTTVIKDPNDDTKFIVTTEPKVPNQNVVIKVPENEYTDSAGNPGTEGEKSADMLPPDVKVTYDATLGKFVVDFSEVAYKGGSELTADQLKALLQISNGTIGNVVQDSNDPTKFTVEVTPTDSTKDVTLTVPNQSYTDAQGNKGSAGNDTNDVPVAQDQSAELKEDTTITVGAADGLLKGATDADPGTQFSVVPQENQKTPGGTITINADGSYTYTPDLNFYGTDTIKFTVKDENGLLSEKTLTIVVTPVDDPITLPKDGENQPLFTHDGESYTSNIKIINVDGTSDPVTYKLDGGDIPVGNLQKLDLGAAGYVLLNTETGIYTYVPAPGYSGDNIDYFNVIVTDGNNNSVTVRVDIEVNATPTAEGAKHNAIEDQTTPITGNVNGQDSDDTELTYFASQGSKGTVTIDQNGNYSYLPIKDAFGQDTFTVTVTDPHGKSTTVTITVDIEARPDDIGLEGEKDQSFKMQENTAEKPTKYDGQIKVIDVDKGDGSGELTYSIKGATGNTFTTEHGVVTINPATGEYTYTPEQDYYGDDDTFTVIVKDPDNNTFEVTVNVDINEAPTGTADDVLTNKDIPVSGQVVGADRDGKDTLSYTVKTPSADGQVHIDSATGEYIFTPANGFTGETSFIVEIIDNAGGEPFFVTVNIFVNAAPTVEFNADFKFVAVDEDVNDIDGDGISNGYIIDLENILKITDDNTDPKDLILSVGKASNGTVVYDEVTGKFIYTPKHNYFGKDSFVLTVSDGKGGVTEVIIPIEVAPVNDAPIGQDESIIANEGAIIRGGLVATDVDSNKFTYSAKPSQNVTDNGNGTVTIETDRGTLILNTATGKYTYQAKLGATGQDVIDFVVNDGATVNATDDFTLTINIDYKLTASAESKTTEQDKAVEGMVISKAGIAIDSYVVSQQATNGKVNVDPVTGKYTYTPNPDYFGNDNFVITVTDENGKTVEVPVNITVTPKGVDGAEDKPELPEDSPIDPNDEDIHYELDPNNPPVNGTVTVDPNTGDYIYVPDPGKEDLGDDFNIIVTDGKNPPTTIEVKIEGTQNFDVQEDQTITDSIKLDGSNYQGHTQPKFGTVTVQPDGTFTYIPNKDFFGKDSFFVNVKNPDGTISKIPVTIEVAPVNDAPVASDIEIATPANIPVDGFFKATDVDGDQLTYSFVGTSDPNVFITKNGGTLTITDPKTGAYTYQPPAGIEDPTEKITVKVSDGNVETEFDVILKVEGYDDATADLITVTEDHLGQDISGFIKLNGELTKDFRISTDPKNGKLITNPDGTIFYKPNKDYFGKDTFVVEVKDSTGQWVKVLVPVEVTSVNDAPVGNPVTTTIAEDTDYVIKITGSDVDSNKIQFKYDDIEANKPKNGEVVFENGQWIYKPKLDFAGTDTFKMTIFDEDGGSSTVDVTVTVTPVNDAPTAVVINDVNAVEETKKTFDLSDYLTVDDIDTDLSKLTYSVSASNGDVSIVDGKITYLGKQNFSGIDYITVVIDDGQGGVTEAKIPVHVENVNDAPTAQAQSFTVQQFGQFSGKINANDVDGDSLTYTAKASDKGAKITINSDGTFVYEPGAAFGSDKFVVTVSDGKLSVDVVVDVTITPKPLDQASAKMATFSLGDDVLDTDHKDQTTTSQDSLSNDVIFNVLSDDNTGGNSLTTLDHFTAADQIDISDLLDNNATLQNISEYLTVSYDADADQAVISIDRDGTADSYQSTELLVLNNQTTDVTLDELLKNNQIII
ncbi:tandem-95 repeat protein, partial [Acinetobacter sp. WCHAc060025]|uniref:tandem-95 repeat protein n=1 Tax=Acinetobacter sp. WCHAc060025 TaxID=2518625 RepID=UPI001023C86F